MNIDDRRRLMVKVFVRTWSLKSSVKTASKRSGVSEAALRVDWHRSYTWPKEVFCGISDSVMRDFYLLGVHRTLRQIERELVGNANPSCRVGLLKAKAEILFKLIDFQQVFDNQALLKRIEALEKRLEAVVEKQNEEAK